jgi:hypothetical protein
MADILRQPRVTFVPVDSLLLDPDNPRLPAEVHGSGQRELFKHLLAHGALDELIGSMLDNGFFEHEPLITLKPDRSGHRVVVEGNRRLAALMAIHGLPPAGATAPLGDIAPERLAELHNVPIFEISDPGEVQAFLGYRHISGLKPWPAEAKARYIYARVEAAKAGGHPNPFAEVARAVGSNSLGIRNFYLAYVILVHAREECGTDVRHVLTSRFGVWYRCMNSPELRAFMSLGDPKAYEEIKHQLARLDCARLEEIIRDLSPVEGAPPVVRDSREITEYGRVLVNERAHAALRRTKDLAIAAQLIKDISLATRVDRIRKQVDALHSEVLTLQEVPGSELLEAAEGLVTASRVLRGTLRDLSEDASARP